MFSSINMISIISTTSFISSFQAFTKFIFWYCPKYVHLYKGQIWAEFFMDKWRHTYKIQVCAYIVVYICVCICIHTCSQRIYKSFISIKTCQLLNRPPHTALAQLLKPLFFGFQRREMLTCMFNHDIMTTACLCGLGLVLCISRVCGHTHIYRPPHTALAQRLKPWFFGFQRGETNHDIMTTTCLCVL